ncbi:MAG TPA: flagellar basal body L-ring protein FlgH, partial [Planctomycetota bacterium]|nr:flagellar basal body L-ring protein FlgH [Planctomycetota bacterium]
VFRAESLFKAEILADGILYFDQVARRAGDLITIMVKETTSVSEQNKIENKRENTIDAAISLVPGTNQVPAQIGTASAGKLPALKAASSKDFKGEGKVEAQGEVKAVITGRVIDVLDNGNLLVEGRRVVRVNKDTKTILITGIIRTADIQANNTVMSEKLHNFQVSIEGEGPLARSGHEGFLGELLDILWPF